MQLWQFIAPAETRKRHVATTHGTFALVLNCGSVELIYVIPKIVILNHIVVKLFMYRFRIMNSINLFIFYNTNEYHE